MSFAISPSLSISSCPKQYTRSHDAEERVESMIAYEFGLPRLFRIESPRFSMRCAL
jgi:hypothetical protein